MKVAASDKRRQAAATGVAGVSARPDALQHPAEPRVLEEQSFRPRGAVLVTLLYLGLVVVLWGYMYWSLVMGR